MNFASLEKVNPFNKLFASIFLFPDNLISSTIINPFLTAILSSFFVKMILPLTKECFLFSFLMA